MAVDWTNPETRLLLDIGTIGKSAAKVMLSSQSCGGVAARLVLRSGGAKGTCCAHLAMQAAGRPVPGGRGPCPRPT